ncbi:sodium-dependent phosphate transport protein 2B-like [Ruditapes philippinarum]|uniref:sodium-dependent phosphate transport protein 2B-like n=1 Tax=Ruditapes philippinarum TaxID=129788 RepID=UPI00295BC4E0|nr:sodium-dependent phosphate transport protein 2B-like [Ruditapes philippinarum]
MEENNLELGVLVSNKAYTGQNDSDAHKEPEVHIEVDPWELPEVQVIFTKWSDLSCYMKVKRVAVGVGKTILLLGCLYFFICSLDLMSKSFRLIGGKR